MSAVDRAKRISSVSGLMAGNAVPDNESREGFRSVRADARRSGIGEPEHERIFDILFEKKRYGADGKGEMYQMVMDPKRLAARFAILRGFGAKAPAIVFQKSLRLTSRKGDQRGWLKGPNEVLSGVVSQGLQNIPESQIFGVSIDSLDTEESKAEIDGFYKDFLKSMDIIESAESRYGMKDIPLTLSIAERDEMFKTPGEPGTEGRAIYDRLGSRYDALLARSYLLRLNEELRNRFRDTDEAIEPLKELMLEADSRFRGMSISDIREFSPKIEELDSYDKAILAQGAVLHALGVDTSNNTPDDIHLKEPVPYDPKITIEDADVSRFTGDSILLLKTPDGKQPGELSVDTEGIDAFYPLVRTYDDGTEEKAPSERLEMEESKGHLKLPFSIEAPGIRKAMRMAVSIDDAARRYEETGKLPKDIPSVITESFQVGYDKKNRPISVEPDAAAVLREWRTIAGESFEKETLYTRLLAASDMLKSYAADSSSAAKAVEEFRSIMGSISIPEKVSEALKTIEKAAEDKNPDSSKVLTEALAAIHSEVVKAGNATRTDDKAWDMLGSFGVVKDAGELLRDTVAAAEKTVMDSPKDGYVSFRIPSDKVSDFADMADGYLKAENSGHAFIPQNRLPVSGYIAVGKDGNPYMKINGYAYSWSKAQTEAYLKAMDALPRKYRDVITEEVSNSFLKPLKRPVPADAKNLTETEKESLRKYETAVEKRVSSMDEQTKGQRKMVISAFDGVRRDGTIRSMKPERLREYAKTLSFDGFSSKEVQNINSRLDKAEAIKEKNQKQKTISGRGVRD